MSTTVLITAAVRDPSRRMRPRRSDFRRRSTVAGLVILDPQSTDPELQCGEYDDHDEQGDGDGRGIPHVEPLEADLSEVHHHAARVVARAATGEHDDRLVDLERADHGHRNVEEE